jgi:L-ascorbate metabolism protein UlaG (beta-lactamase superfamily)
MSDPLFLRRDVVTKPLVNRWCATEQMIPPAQVALNVKNVQTELLRSFLAAPDYHYKAARTPSLIGGPWVDVEEARIGEVKDLLAKIEGEQKWLLEFARALEDTDKLLRAEAKGGAMRAVYKKVPDALRGYVELVYDINGVASFRLIEALLYRSRYYDRSLQSVALTRVADERRPFQNSTPFLDDPSHVHVRRPFDDAAFDALFAMKRRARPAAEIEGALGLTEAESKLFRTFLTPEAPPPPARFDGEGVRIRYFGHACTLIESAKVSILSDPMVSYAAMPGGPARFTFDDLPESIDYAVLTHDHKDHVYFETLLQLRHAIRHLVIPKNGGGTICDPSFKAMLRAIGFRSVIDLERFEEVAFPGGRILALPFLGEHADLDIQSKCAQCIEIEGQRILCAADSDNVEPRIYQHIRRELGEIDVLFLGMECVGAPLSAVYGGLLLRPIPRQFDQARRTTGCNYDGAIAIVEEVRPKHVYIYAMGLEPWLHHILPIEEERDSMGVKEAERLVAECTKRGLTAARPYCRMELHLPAK